MSLTNNPAGYAFWLSPTELDAAMKQPAGTSSGIRNARYEDIPQIMVIRR
jgi:hypothetical protein